MCTCIRATNASPTHRGRRIAPAVAAPRQTPPCKGRPTRTLREFFVNDGAKRRQLRWSQIIDKEFPEGCPAAVPFKDFCKQPFGFWFYGFPETKRSDCMWFKLTYSLQTMRVRRADQLPISVLDDDNSREIIFWNRQLQGHPDQLCCDAVRSKELKAETLSMFETLLKGYLPLDDPPQVSLPLDLSFDVQIDRTGKIPPKWGVPLAAFPNKFQQLSSSVQRELIEDTKTFVKTLRWRQGSTGTQSPFAQVGYYFSPDKVAWHPMPHAIIARLLETKAIDADPGVLEQTKSLWMAGEREPLGHELVREAMDINLSTPRSSLMMAVSALETGLKSHLAYCVPNSNIILEKIPSPPALTFLQDIIPAVHKAVGIDQKYFPLNADGKNFVQKWISQRNQIAHGTKDNVDSEAAGKFIRFVRSILYALDACRGHGWAEHYVRGEDFLQ